MCRSNGMIIGGRLLFTIMLGLAGCFPDPAKLPNDTDDEADAGPGEDGMPDGVSGDAASGGCTTADDCTDLAAPCVKVLCLANTCATQPDPGAMCDDGNPCTRNDTCAGTTCAGTPYTCDDGIACTDDRCDGAGGCTYPAAEGFCHIGGLCVAAGTTLEGDACRICSGGESWSPNDGASCDDGDTCTTTDLCDGTACVGRGRPSDAATDWASQPIDARTPAQAWNHGVGPAAVDDIFVLTRAAGSATIDVSPEPVALEQASVAFVRRTRSGTHVPTLVWTGFENANVRAYRRPVRTDEQHALAVSLKGAGRRVTGSGSVPVGTANENMVELACVERLGSVQMQRSWPYSVSAALCHTAGLVVAGNFTGSFALSDAPALNWHDASRPNSWRAYVAGLGTTGTPSHALFLASDAFLGEPELFRTSDGETWVSISIQQNLRIVDSGGQEVNLQADEGWWRYVLLHVDAGGKLLSHVMPFRFESEPEAPGVSFAPPEIVAWEAEGPIVVVRGHVQEQVSPPFRITQPRDAVSIVALTPTWRWRWAVTLEGAAVGTNAMHALFWRTPAGLVAPWAGLAGGVTLRAGNDVRIGGDATMGLMGIGLDGRVMFFQGLTSDQLFPMAVVGLPDGSIVLGATTVFRQAVIEGAGSRLTLPSTADFSAHVFGLNTNGGLICLPDP